MEALQVTLNTVSRLEDGELIRSLERMVREDRQLTARLLVQLGEVDARGLFRERAWSSMFAYAVSELHMSEAEAYLRIHAARLGRRFPLVVELVGKGVLHLSAIKLLGPHLTPENHAELLARASCKSKREVEVLVAEIALRPDVQSVLAPVVSRPKSASAATACGSPLPLEVVARARVPATRAEPEKVALAVTSPCADATRASPVVDARPVPALASEPPAVPVLRLAPLSPGRFKLQLTAGQALHDKLIQLQELLRHRVPNGDLAVIVEQAVDVLLEKTVRERFAQTKRARKQASGAQLARVERARKSRPAPQRLDVRISEAEERELDCAAAEAAADAGGDARAAEEAAGRSRASRSRYVPRAVVRAVYARDGGCCAFVSPDGRRCSERGFLELHHHDVPHARGGAATVENLRLLCRAHNALFAEQDFGGQFIRAKVEAARARAVGTGSGTSCMGLSPGARA